jgi:hypothetical protein
VTKGLSVGAGDASVAAGVGVGLGVGLRSSPVPMLIVHAASKAVSTANSARLIRNLIH